FITIQAPPEPLTGFATARTMTSDVLNGSVNPNGFASTAYFDYGPTTAYGSQTPVQPSGNGQSPVAVSNAVTGLNPAGYHFRLVAGSVLGTNFGRDQFFLTSDFAPATSAHLDGVNDYLASGGLNGAFSNE